MRTATTFRRTRFIGWPIGLVVTAIFGAPALCANNTDPAVTCVYKWKANLGQVKCDERVSEARLNDTLVVEVDHLDKLMDEAQCIEIEENNQKTQKPGCKQHDVVLFMDGRELKLSPESTDIPGGKLFYKLKINADTRPLWIDLLG